jgi:CheY-like chemotaxis protein
MFTIMVVDDSPMTLTLVKGLIDDCAIFETNVISFDNPVHAQHEFQRINPDFVITDIVMPEVDGYEFIDFVKSQKDIPILAISGSYVEENSPDTLLYCAQKLGANFSLSKEDIGTKRPSLVKEIFLQNSM